ncbi:concanavalin A-like lectin/glucanase [Marasmius fiardii PR-910]|nr:concanavalin A-like lectin/glucanase [Marasmius fiardii PR-910]
MSHLPSPNPGNHSFRAPFLSPSSRPTSSVWSPPSLQDLHSQVPSTTSPTGSTTALPSTKAPLPSTRLSQPLTKSDKPWLSKSRGFMSPGRDRLSYLVTLLCLVLGLGGAACLVFFDTRPNSIHRLADSDLCLILNDQFTGGDIDSSVWKRDVGLGGFGNGEFQVMTSSSDNAKIVNNQLYIIPTLTSARIGSGSIFDGYTYNADGCTTPQNKSACAVRSSANTSTVIPPVESARLTTNGTKTIRYGRVEVRAKLPQGDWLWPAIWMLPQDNNYGQWPLSGEIDIIESRGNSVDYPFEGVNYARSSLNYGPLPGVLAQLTSSVPMKRAKAGFAEDFHTYTLEWSPTFMRMYIDTRLHATLDLSTTKTKESFWTRGGFPATAPSGNSSSEVVVENVWEKHGGGVNAPYDQDFYLIISLAAGGTSGWFPDNLGGKSWADGSRNAMVDFAKAQDQWSKTWPENLDDRAFRM